jgi:hypothetical protein
MQQKCRGIGATTKAAIRKMLSFLTMAASTNPAVYGSVMA